DGPVVEWDLERETMDAAGLQGVDAVVHLAGEPFGARRLTSERKRKIRESREVSTRLLAKTLAEVDDGPRVLISQSGTNYYGDRGDERLTEASARGPGSFFTDVCLAWEAATRPAVEAGIRTVNTRTAFVLDADGGSLPKLVLNTKLGAGGRIGDGQQWMAWVTRDDAVRAIRFLLAHDSVSGPVNVTAPEPVRNRDFSHILGQVLHRPTFIPIPKFGPALVLGRELAEDLLFSSFRVEPAVLLAAGFEFRHPTLRGALEDVLGR
ncbi:MAG TPA: TIGR01777 family oxidoreductase, partial [Acidimicrobiales bacterium]|nr:TIGR01777 family oxidoreductase [Acidimicrobiales bacterium]